MRMSFVRTSVVVSLLLVLTACGGLPGKERKEAKDLSDTIASVETTVAEREKAFKTSLAGDAEIAQQANRENLNTKFSLARRDLKLARDTFTKDVAPILKQNEEESLAKLKAGTARVKVLIDSAKRISAEPAARVALLKKVKQTPDMFFSLVKPLAKNADGDQKRIATLAAMYGTKHPNKRDAITARTKAGPQGYAVLKGAMQDMTSQEALKKSGQALNYATIADGYTAIVRESGALEKLRMKTEKDLPNLDRAYSKVLIDQKDVYTVCITRTSWRESEDYNPTLTPLQYPCKEVTDDMFETAEAFSDDVSETPLATYGYGWSSKGEFRLQEGFGNEITAADVQALWKHMGIKDPSTNWPEGDNSSTFDIESAEATYFHRYAYLENGVRKEGGWEKVSPELFEKHWDHLGLALVEKPYGAFEDETVTDGVPPGMTLVGNPKAGEWRSDGSGGNIWFWLYMYERMYGNQYGPNHRGYSRAEWDDYQSRRGRGAYTGVGANPTYGTAGSATRTGPLAGNDFGRRGGFQEASAQMRGAGPAGRSGGPTSGK